MNAGVIAPIVATPLVARTPISSRPDWDVGIDPRWSPASSVSDDERGPGCAEQRHERMSAMMRRRPLG
jgi:hypothetical protein